MRHPVLVLAIGLAVTAAIAPGMVRLRLRTDGHALVPERSPAVALDHAIRERFDIRDPIVVLIRPSDPAGIYNPGTLHLVADLSAAFARLAGLDTSNVRSLATEHSDRYRPGTLRHRLLLEPLPTTREQIDELRGDVDAIGLLTGTLVSFDGRAAAIHVGTPPAADRTALLAAIHRVIARADTAGHAVDVIGAPVAELLLGTHILDDLGVRWGRRPELAEPPAPERGAIARLRGAVARHVGLLPISIAVMALVFLVCFRSPIAALLPLTEAAACLVFVFGLMGWCDVPVYLTMAVLPVILVSMGLADEIHVFTACARAHARDRGRPIAESVRAALDELTVPVVATSMTTAIGFLSFALSPLAPVRAFGLFTAAGIVFCMIWTLTVIPASLVLLGPRAIGATRPEASEGIPGFGWWDRLARPVARRPFVMLAVALLGLALTPLGIRRLVVQDSWISGFAAQSAFHRATEYFNHNFYGTHRLLLALDAGGLERRGSITSADLTMRELLVPADVAADPEMVVGCSLVVERRIRPGPPDPFRPSYWTSVVEGATRQGDRLALTTPVFHGSPLFMLSPAPGETLDYRLRSQRLAVPAVLRRVDSLERFVRAQDRLAVGGVLGPADQVVTAEFLTSDRDSEFRSIPNDPERVRWLWNAIAMVQGPERLAQVVDPDLRHGLVMVFLRHANYVDTARLLDSLRVYARRHLEPAHIGLAIGGDVAVSQTLIEAIVDSQVRSVALSLVGILLVNLVLLRSLRFGVICTLPAAIAVAVTFAIMGASGMPLGVATSMFAGMVLGIGVDFAIHLVERFRLTLAGGAGRDRAIEDALIETGPPIVINALAIALGFGILLLSRVPANARLGAMTAVGLLACLAATVLVIPALLRLTVRARPKS